MKKIIALCLLTFACGYAAHASVTETKTLSHRFENESAASKLSIISIYSNINITQADQNYIDVRVEIKATSRNEEQAKKMLDGINVSFSGKGTSCSVKTDMKSNTGSGNNNSFEIQITVRIPRGARLHVDNKYGNLNMGDLDGTFTAEIKYGNINTGELRGSGNAVDLKYGNLTMDSTPDLKLDMGYSNLRAVNIANLRVDSKYSNVNAGYIANLLIGGSAYDNFTMDKAHTVKASSGSAGIKIGTLIKSIDLPGVKYGNVEIGKVETGFDMVNIHASYASVRINFEKPSFSYILESNYGGIDLGNLPHNNTIEMKGYTEYKMEGTAGGGSAEKVKITANYGKITLGEY